MLITYSCMAFVLLVAYWAGARDIGLLLALCLWPPLAVLVRAVTFRRVSPRLDPANTATTVLGDIHREMQASAEDRNRP